MNAPLFTLTLAALPIHVTPLLLIGMAAALILALNATLMLVAPTRYDILPRWLRPPVALIETQLHKPKGTAETRITGFLVLSMIIWVVYDMLTRPH